MKFTVPDPASLWRAAARYLERNGLEAGDVDETIGVIEDPSIDDCLATLMLPAVAEGCDLVDFHIEQADRPGFDPGSCTGLRADH